MDELLKIVFSWSKTNERWPLLLLFIVPAVFSFSKLYFDLTFKDTLHHWSFLVSAGVLLLLVGVLYFVTSYQGIAITNISIASTLIIFGITAIAAGVLVLTPPSLPEDKLVITITKFSAVNEDAKNETNTFPHRIAQELKSKIDEGTSILINQIDLSISGGSDAEKQENALKLGNSRKGKAHIVLWGDVRKEEGELYVHPYITVCHPLGEIIIDQREPGEFVSEEPTLLQFKKVVSSQIADLVALLYGLTYYKTSKWNKAAQILNSVKLPEAGLYKALCLKGEYIEHFKRTGQMDDTHDLLKNSKKELDKASNQFLIDDKLDLAALSSIGLGDILRIQNYWEQAIQEYQHAIEIAKKANTKRYQAKALTGIARAKMLGLKQYNSAKTDALLAVSIYEKIDEDADLADAINFVALAQTGLKEFNQAIETLEKAKVLAIKLSDEMRLFYIYFDIADVYEQMVSDFDCQEKIELCMDALSKAENNYINAGKYSTKLGYEGLSRSVEGLIQNLQMKRQLINTRTKSSQL